MFPHRPPCPGCTTSASPVWSASSLASAWDQVGLGQGEQGAVGQEWGLRGSREQRALQVGGRTSALAPSQTSGPGLSCCTPQARDHHKIFQPRTSPGHAQLLPPRPCSWAKRGGSPGSLSQTSLEVSPAPITVRLASTVLPLTEHGHDSGLEQQGVKPGLVYPVDVLAELLTDL